MNANISELRTNVATGTSFVSLPEAFTGADEAVRFSPKVALGVGRFDNAKHPLHLDIVIDPHLLLVDMEAVAPDEIDMSRLIRDCDLLKEAALSDPEVLRDILRAFGRDVPHERILEAANTAKRLGLSEDEIVEGGGGFLWLLVVVVAIALSGCKSCAHTKGSLRQ